MTQFTSGSEEPKGRAESGFSIRKKTDWTGVFDQLEAAKHEYSKETGFRGGFRKVYRKLADNVAKPALGATKFVPDVDYVTPVLGAVQVLLEVGLTDVGVTSTSGPRMPRSPEVLNNRQPRSPRKSGRRSSQPSTTST